MKAWCFSTLTRLTLSVWKAQVIEKVTCLVKRIEEYLYATAEYFSRARPGATDANILAPPPGLQVITQCQLLFETWSSYKYGF